MSTTFSKINIYKPIAKEKIKFFKDVKSPSHRSKETSALKGFVDRSSKDKRLASTTSMTGVNSTNAHSVLQDYISIDGVSNPHGSAKSKRARQPFIPPL